MIINKPNIFPFLKQGVKVRYFNLYYKRMIYGVICNIKQIFISKSTEHYLITIRENENSEMTDMVFEIGNEEDNRRIRIIR